MMATSKVSSKMRSGGAPPNKQQIKSALIGAGLQKVDNNVLSKCVAMASTLHLTAETIAEVWEAYSLNKQNLTELTMHQFEGYKNQLILASTVAPTPDGPQSMTPRAIMVSEKPVVKREPASMVTPMSAAKRQKQESPDMAMSSVDRVAMDGSAVPSPVRSSTPSGRPAPNLPKYDKRTKVGQTVASYPANRESNRDTQPKGGRRRCVVTTNGETDFGAEDVTKHNISQPFRYMFTTMEDRANALENHLVRMKEAIVNEIKTEMETKKQNSNDENVPASFEEVNVPRQDPSTCIGRICNEAHTGRLNATSVVLEGSSSSCGGARVNVDLSHVQVEKQPQGYSLFPGQIVALEGMNGTGRKIAATKLMEGVPLPPSSSRSSAIREFYYGNENEPSAPVKVISACGPFTTADSMDYEPFIDLIHVVMDEKADVVILMGPFVDVRHEAVKNGNPTVDAEGERLVVDYETVFAQNISALMEELFESGHSPDTEFVLVPALEDATAKCVYPQPPLQDSLPKGGNELNHIPGAEGIEFGSSGLHRLTKAQESGKPRVHCLSNPCTFRINEVVFGATSTDVLFHMSVEETNSNLPVGSRMRRISQHMVQQQSYYPLFPPNKSVNLDLKQQDGWRMPCRPDVLMVPSRLTPFCAPILGSTMAVNPGHLTKGTTGGTYAMMEIWPMEKAKLDKHSDDAMLTHDVQDRLQMEIKRI